MAKKTYDLLFKLLLIGVSLLLLRKFITRILRKPEGWQNDSLELLQNYQGDIL